MLSRYSYRHSLPKLGFVKELLIMHDHVVRFIIIGSSQLASVVRFIIIGSSQLASDISEESFMPLVIWLSDGPLGREGIVLQEF